MSAACRGLAVLAVSAMLLGGGVAVPAYADTPPADNVSINAAARNATYDITSIGNIHIQSLTDGSTGKPFNGKLPDGTTVTNGVNASSQGISYILTVNGTIDDIGQLHEGDTVTWTVQPTANSHFRLGCPQLLLRLPEIRSAPEKIRRDPYRHIFPVGKFVRSSRPFHRLRI